MPVVTKQQPITNSQTRTSKSVKSVIGRIAPVHYSEKKDAINIYGVSGTGKTTLACTYPKRLLIAGAEDGTRSVYNLKEVDFVRISHSSEMKELIDYAREEQKYKTFVLDSATSLQAMTLAEILGLEELPPQKSWGMASRDQYGQSALQTKEILRHVLRLAEDGVCHTVILAQEREFGSESDSELIAPTIMSSLTASTVGWLNPACDYIVQTFIRQKEVVKRFTIGGQVKEVCEKSNDVEYCLRTAPHPVYTVKFRGPKDKQIPDVIVDPSYEKIRKLIGNF